MHFGAFAVAIGSTAQAFRWILVARAGLENEQAAARTRSDRLFLRLRVRAASWDWTAWVFIAVGAWSVAIAGLA